MEREIMKQILLGLLLASAISASAAYQGSVKETMNSGGYTYVLLETAEGDLWFAGPEASVSVGQTLTVEQAMPMQNFTARSLDRTFDTIYFAGALGAAPAPAASSSDPHANVPGYKAAMAGKSNRPEAGSIEKADYTVSELFFQPRLLAGKEVSVRGQVTKYNSGILGSNWIHLVDGTGEAGKDDLVVTTSGECSVGDIIVAKGTLAVDKDLGSGYFFPVILEQAALTVEQKKAK